MKENSEVASPPRWWRAPALLACAAFLVYCANGRWIGAVDTLSTELVPIVLLRQGNLDLAEFDTHAMGTPGGSGFAVQTRWGYLPGYPVTTGLVLTPLYTLPVAVFARRHPTTDQWLKLARVAGKATAAAITALSVALFLLLARRLGARPGVALGLAIAYAFGSSAWSISSQALWQHGPSCLLLLLGALLAARQVEQPSLRRSLWLGIVAGLAVAVRLLNVLFVVPLIGWTLLRQRRDVAALLAPLALFTLAVVVYNQAVFGHVTGLYGRMHFETPLAQGIAGVLFSPGRGLFLYCPLALLGIISVLTPEPNHRGTGSLRWPLAVFVALQILVVAHYDVWWGGSCYGPRLLTEVQPALLLSAIPLFDVPLRRHAAMAALVGLLFAWSIFTQAVGAILSSGSWDAAPQPIDRSPERLWEWRDNPIARDLTPERFRWVVFRPRPLTDFRSEYAVSPTAGAAAGEILEIPVRLRNTGSQRWLPYGEGIGFLAVHLGYHFAPLHAPPAERREGPRTPLPGITSPGEEVTVRLRVEVPAEPGEYLLEVSLVQESVGWFESLGSPPARVRLSVAARLHPPR